MIVTKNIADTLKELDYNEPCYNYYSGLFKDPERFFYSKSILTIKSHINTLAPTQTDVCKWLRSNYNIHVSVVPALLNKYFYSISKLSLNNFPKRIYGSPYNPKDSEDTYEKALEVGISEALKLISNELENTK